MADVNLVKSIYTGGVVTSLGELAAADQAVIPGTAKIGSLAGFLFGTAGVISANPITWTSWTPTLTAGTGTPTTVTTTGYYVQIGKIAFVQFTLTITDAGSAGNAMNITNLPIAAPSPPQSPGLIREGGATGKIYQCFINGANSCTIQDYTGASNAWVSGYILNGMFIYRAS